MKSVIIATYLVLSTSLVWAQRFDEISPESVSTQQGSGTTPGKLLNGRLSISIQGQIQTIQPPHVALKHHISYKYPYAFPKDLVPEVSVPFHAAHLLHLSAQTKLTDRLSVLVRLVLEEQSYCSAYLDKNYNNIVWSKLSVAYESVFSGLSKSDTLYFRGGDLGRSRCGEGILLDDYDGEGIKIAYSLGSLRLQRTMVGFGITESEDISYTSLSYRNLVSLNVFMNNKSSTDMFVPFGGGNNSHQPYYQLVPSLSYHVPVLEKSSSLSFSQTDIFGEMGIMEDHIDAFRMDVNRCAFLVGASQSINAGKNTCKLEAQYRWYGEDFNRTVIDHVSDQPYSQVSCDKRFNNWFNYLRAAGDIKGMNFCCTFKKYLTSSWFTQGDVEFLKTSGALDETDLLYQIGIGLDLGENLSANVLATNRIINRYLRKISYKDKEHWYTYDTSQLPTFLETERALFTLRLTFQL